MTTLTISPAIAYNPRRLAAALAAAGAPGTRSMTAITRLRRARRNNRPVTTAALGERLNAALIAQYGDEIRRRGGETSIITGKTSSIPLKVVDRRGGLTLLRVAGQRRYGAQNRYAQISYLCGKDDNGLWTVRVAGTITTVTAALAWVTPAAVHTASAAGRRVDRQGDIYAIATARGDAPTGWVGDDWRDDGSGQSVTSHHWDAQTRVLTHHPEDGRTHAPLHLPHPVRFVQQRSYQHGRTNRWGSGD